MHEDSFSLPHSWRFAGLALLSALVAALLILHQTVGFLVDAWRTASYSHGFLIVPITGYLVWLQRRRIAQLEPSPNPWALLALVPCATAWLFGNLVDVRSVQEFACLLAIIAVVWTLLGSRLALALRFPLAFLFFALPLGDSLIPALQDFTARIAIWALQATGIPAVLRGRVIEVPSGFWEVAATCSGLRFLTASIVLGFLFAGLFYRTWTKRIIFLIASFVLPILANGVRVYGIILLGHLTNNRLAAGVDHIVYGWIFSTLVGLALFAIGWRWREKPEPDSPLTDLPGSSNEALVPAPSFKPADLKIVMLAALCVALIAVGPFTSYFLSSRQVYAAPKALVSPKASSPWTIQASRRESSAPDSSSATSELREAYSDGAREVQLYVAYYAPEIRGTDVVNAKPAVYNATRWFRVSGRLLQITTGSRPLDLNETVIASRTDSRLLWSWYCVNGEFASSAYREKIREVESRLRGRSQGSALIVLSADLSPEQTHASATLRDFLAHTSWREDLLPLCQ